MDTVSFDISALDASFKEHATRGIGRYVSELKRYFDHHSFEDFQVTTFDHGQIWNGSLLGRACELLPAGRVTVKQQLLFPFRLGALPGGKRSVLHFPAQMDAPTWCSRKTIVTVLDLIPVVLADLYRAERPGWRFQLARWLERRAIKNASLIIAISECTARDVVRCFGINRERIVVTPLGVDSKFFIPRSADTPPEEQARARFKLPSGRPVILYVGGIDQRKNWRGLLTTLAALKERAESSGRPSPVLAMVGKIDQDRQFPALNGLISELGLKDDVVCTGYLPDSELFELYQISALFLFLSLYEGFGLPPLEAAAAGVPVVSSNRASLPEVLEEGALLVDPEWSEDVVAAIESLLEDPSKAYALGQQGQAHARRFSWERTGELTADAYRRCLRLQA